MKSTILIIACGLLPVCTARADETHDIAPFLDETVFAVARIDLELLVPADVALYLRGQAPEASDLSDLLAMAQQTLRDLGASRVYAVYSFRDVGDQMPYLIVPASDPNQARRIAAYFYTGDPDGPTSLDIDQRAAATRMFDVAEPIGSTVFCGTRSARRRLDDAPAVDRRVGRIVQVDVRTRTVWINLGSRDDLQTRATFSVYPQDQSGIGRGADGVTAKVEVTRVLGPHIAEARIIEADLSRPIGEDDPIHAPSLSVARSGLGAALAVAGDSAVSFVVAPTDDQRRVVAEMFPTLPADLGGLGGAELAAGLMWIAAGVDPAANSTNVVFEATDEGFAVRLSESLPPLIMEFLSDQSATVNTEDARVVLEVDSMQAASPLVSRLLRSLARAGARYDTMQSLKQLALAMHNFHDRWSGFPPSASYDPAGRPLLSWRVHLLPFLEATELYEQFHLDEPWDSPHNRELITRMPDVFRSNDISLNLAGKTRFLLPISEETPWHGQIGTQIREIIDGTSNTIMILEAESDRAAVWTRPADLMIDWERVGDGLAGDGDGFNVVLCDGSARRIRPDIDNTILIRLLKHADGEVIGDYDIHPQD